MYECTYVRTDHLRHTLASATFIVNVLRISICVYSFQTPTHTVHIIYTYVFTYVCIFTYYIYICMHMYVLPPDSHFSHPTYCCQLLAYRIIMYYTRVQIFYITHENQYMKQNIIRTYKYNVTKKVEDESVYKIKLSYPILLIVVNSLHIE